MSLPSIPAIAQKRIAKTVYFSPAEWAAVRALASEHDLEPSRFIRMTMSRTLRMARPQGVTEVVAERGENISGPVLRGL